MLKTAHRDLLVVSKSKDQTAEWLEQELQSLEHLLYTVEMAQNVAISTEVFDVNRFRVYRKQKDIIRMLLKKETRSFIFFINRN